MLQFTKALRPMDLKDQFNTNREVKGIFTLKIIHKDGRILEEYEDKNLIVDQARFNMARLISAAGNNKYIDKFGWGIGATAPDPGDLNLTGGGTKAIASVTYPDNISVKFNWTLELNEANGLSITEFGLFSNNNDLFSRKTRGAIVKESDFRLEGSWRIIF